MVAIQTEIQLLFTESQRLSVIEIWSVGLNADQECTNSAHKHRLSRQDQRF